MRNLKCSIPAARRRRNFSYTTLAFFRDIFGTCIFPGYLPAFGSTHSDTEIAAVSNYVTARFGSARSGITDKDVAGLRTHGPMM